jgi:hypothetical protein
MARSWLLMLALPLANCATAEYVLDKPADISHLIFIDGCQPDGCVMYPGDDDARTGRSSILTQPARVGPFTLGDARWQELVDCVTRIYSAFDVQVTLHDPGRDAPHFSLIVGGDPSDLGLSAYAGGAAPVVCPETVRDNGVAFAFSAREPDAAHLCWAAVQELGHVFGLDHEIDPYDPMSWIGEAKDKQAFDDRDASCGEFDARECTCSGRDTQNSLRLLTTVLGAGRTFL